MPLKPARPDPETLALAALAYLAGAEEELARFLALSGLDLGQLRALTADPKRRGEALGAVLDHLLGDERLLLAFAEAQGCRPEEVALARSALP